MTSEPERLLKLLGDISASLDATTERLARAESADLALRVVVARLLVCVASAGSGSPAERLDFLVTQLRGFLEGALANNTAGYDHALNTGALATMEDTVSIAEAILHDMGGSRSLGDRW